MRSGKSTQNAKNAKCYLKPTSEDLFLELKNLLSPLRYFRIDRKHIILCTAYNYDISQKIPEISGKKCISML